MNRSHLKALRSLTQTKTPHKLDRPRTRYRVPSMLEGGQNGGTCIVHDSCSDYCQIHHSREVTTITEDPEDNFQEIDQLLLKT